ncbi:hypothetical protein DEO72_LG7g2136 [Vigna unguiculata]|uniref:Uncharacterized protein n=1 Tax=Vigna unguiculata TaxID=3917 RepID=A0A4D6MM56_VIGUN|nr:hypothetical protein DEO72_LG7g2136 [Vigna unguiculata]
MDQVDPRTQMDQMGPTTQTVIEPYDPDKQGDLMTHKGQTGLTTQIGWSSLTTHNQDESAGSMAQARQASPTTHTGLASQTS